MAFGRCLQFTGGLVLLLSLFGCASSGNTIQQTQVWDAYNACRATGRVDTNIQIDRVESGGRWWFRTSDGSHGRQELEACMREEIARRQPTARSAATPLQTASATAVLSDIKADFVRQQQQSARNRPEPWPGIGGYQLSRDLYVTTLAKSAETAGLKRGDRITKIGGMEVSDRSEASRASRRIPFPGQSALSTLREGQSAEVSIPCRDGQAAWKALDETLQAAVEGDWEGCIRHERDFAEAVGYVSSFALWREYRCVLGRNRSSGRNTDAHEARLLYDYNRLLLSEARFSPDEFASAPATALTNISYLQNARYPTLASDLERLLADAEGSISVSKVPKATGTEEKREIVRGTAFVVRPDGLLLTAFHVIDSAKTIDVVCQGQKAMRAEVRQQTRSSDLAVLRIDSATLDYLPLAPPRSARVADHVFTVGFPATDILGMEPKFTDGSVSSLSGLGGEATVMQTSVQVQAGSSGGPLMNERGEVIGIMTSTAAVVAFTKATGSFPQNVNWAVKADYAAPLFDPPTKPRPATTREDSIERALRAVCVVEVQR